MRETLEQIRMHLWMVLHHRWSALLGAALTCILGWLALLAIPDKYEVQAKVFLDSQSVLKPLLQGLAPDDNSSEQTAAIIQRTMMTRENIEGVIANTDLKKVLSNPQALEKTILWLSNSIEVSSAAVPDQNNDRRSISNIYTVAFRNKSPNLAKQVVDAVLSMFLDRVRTSSQRDVTVAQTFLDDQVTEYKTKLEQAEENLKKFKIAHPGLVPEPGAKAFADRLQDAQLAVEQARVALRETEFRAEALRREVASAAATVAAGAVIPGGPIALTAEQQRVQTLQAKLDELRATYTDQHPQVQETMRLLEDAKKQAAAAGTARAAAPMLQPGAEAGLIPMKMMLAQTEADAASKRVQLSDAETKLAALKPISDTIPEIQAELSKLTRDYNIIKDTYEKLVQRRESASLTNQGAIAAGDDSAMKVIEAPRIPLLPIFPDRPLMISAILGLSVLVGAVLAWLRAQSNPAFYTRKQLVGFSDIPVLGTVGMEWTGLEVAKRRLGLLTFLAASALLLAVYGWQMVHFGYDIKPWLQTIESIKHGSIL